MKVLQFTVISQEYFKRSYKAHLAAKAAKRPSAALDFKLKLLTNILTKKKVHKRFTSRFTPPILDLLHNDLKAYVAAKPTDKVGVYLLDFITELKLKKVHTNDT